MKRIARIAVVLSAFGFAAITFVGCNTVEGVGRDVSAVGGATADAASDANPGKD